jgi:hypothetical protein
MSSSTVDAQVVFLELNPMLLPLVELGVKSHVAPSHPRRRRRPRGEPRRDPELARVSSPSPWPEEDDGHGPSIGT